MSKFLGISAGFLLCSMAMMAQAAFADDPACMSKSQALSVNNDQVLSWKADSSIASGWLSRANVEGTVLGNFPDHSGHNHFLIQIGPTEQDTLEVVYNQEFGALPEIHSGMKAHACGDFINRPSKTALILHLLLERSSIGFTKIRNIMATRMDICRWTV